MGRCGRVIKLSAAAADGRHKKNYKKNVKKFLTRVLCYDIVMSVPRLRGVYLVN